MKPNPVCLDSAIQGSCQPPKTELPSGACRDDVRIFAEKNRPNFNALYSV